jgi:hypothetical protein
VNENSVSQLELPLEPTPTSFEDAQSAAAGAVNPICKILTDGLNA